MRLEIHARGLTLDPDTRAHAGRRLATALSRLAGRVDRVAVYLSDENGPRGGVDKVCLAIAHFRGGRAILIEDADPDLRSAIDRVADRIGHTAHRVHDREKPRPPRRGRPRPALN